MSEYKCRITTPSGFIDGVVHIGEESLHLSCESGSSDIYYADILDFRLINYHLFIYLEGETVELSWLGRETEDFFERVWAAINAQAEKALFAEGKPLICVEGDYVYLESQANAPNAKGKAKIILHSDCVCIHPHNYSSRRIPLCFVRDVAVNGYEITIKLDTNDSYTIARLGHDTDPFMRRFNECLSDSKAKWVDAHNELNANLTARLLDRVCSYETMTSLGVKVISGLFSPGDEGFYIAAIGANRAAVELIIGESAATYLYEYPVSPSTFEQSLRHAMEAVNSNREVIYADECILPDKPLFRMAIKYSRHVSFLRNHMCGKLIHNNTWNDKIKEFFA